MKTCFKCDKEKPLSEYYKHPQMGDGHLNKCKDCTRKDTKRRHKQMIKNPDWRKKERRRHREKYHRLGYKEKHKPDPVIARKRRSQWVKRYPEKAAAAISAQHIRAPDGHHKHHWSYREEHYRDVIFVSMPEHYKAHRFLEYDKKAKMFRSESGELLDTREKHEEYLIQKGVELTETEAQTA